MCDARKEKKMEGGKTPADPTAVVHFLQSKKVTKNGYSIYNNTKSEYLLNVCLVWSVFLFL